MTCGAVADPGIVISVAGLLYREARLLDERLFDEWLSLFTEDATYLLPIKAGPPPEPALVRDSRARMEERVYRLTRTLAHAQNPPSLTQHDVTNIEVLAEDQAGALAVACNQTVHELRRGDVFHVGMARERSLHARCRYRLVPSGASWLIQEKRCELLSREFPIYNLTFIF